MKLLVLQWFAVSYFVSDVQALLVVNNVTVPSDAISDLFFSEIQNNFELVNITGYDSNGYNVRKCVQSLREIVREFPSPLVYSFFDAWGKLPSGIQYGNLYDVGNFDQCIGAKLSLPNPVGLINGQYCFATIPLKNGEGMNVPTLDHGNLVRFTLPDTYKINLGICIPDSCDPEFVSLVLKLSVRNSYDGALSGVSISYCQTGKSKPYRLIDIIAIVIFFVFAVLIILSTAYDIRVSCLDKQPKAIFLAFSMTTNLKKLFAISLKKMPNSVDCFLGIRVLSTIWIVYLHTDYAYSSIPTINTIDRFSWTKALWSMHLINGAMSVDTFFFMGGFLVAWMGFQKLDKTEGKLNFTMMYIHRYIRLTPPLAAMLLYELSLAKMVKTGPYPQTGFFGCNGSTWWPVLLYVQNYTRDRCIPVAWYLSADFHLYILAPFLLIPMWMWGKKMIPVLVALAVVPIGWTMAIFIREQYNDLRDLLNPEENQKVYIRTHMRYAPWLVGLGLAHFMYVNREKKFLIPRIVKFVGWGLSMATILLVAFGTYFTISSRGTGTILEVAIYASFKRVAWAMALAWITFACHSGFGGIINTFLSHPFWQPLGRLSYSIYLVHFTVLGFNTKLMRSSMYFSNFNLILYLWSAFGLSVTAAIALALAFELPASNLEKEFFKEKQEKNIIKESISAPSPGVVLELSNKIN